MNKIHTMNLTEQECEVLHAILYGVVGGNPRGPRSIVSDILERLPRPELPKYTANIEEVNRMGNLAVIIKEKKQCV